MLSRVRGQHLVAEVARSAGSEVSTLSPKWSAVAAVLGAGPGRPRALSRVRGQHLVAEVARSGRGPRGLALEGVAPVVS